MEAFSLLKFWRLNPNDDAPTHVADDESDDDETSSEDSFFDLEFTLPGQHDSLNKKDTEDSTASSDFLESPNNVFCSKSEPNFKPQSPISFLRSPPKFKVLMFLKKTPKLEKTTETTTPNAAASSPSTPSRFAVKCDVVDEFPIWSVLNRVNSSRSKLYNKNSDEDLSKGLGKGGVQKYFNLIKPPYSVGVPKRRSSDDDVKVSDPTSSPAAGQRKEAERKQGSSTRTASLRVVGKLVKSRSASSAAVGVAPAPASKRDDSLVLQQDGIQGAILHCKKSYNNSSRDCSLSSRFAGETSSETSSSSRNSSEEDDDDEKKRSSI